MKITLDSPNPHIVTQALKVACLKCSSFEGALVLFYIESGSLLNCGCRYEAGEQNFRTP